MLKLTRERQGVTIETGGGVIAWDAERGGQISRFAIKDELSSHPLVGPAGVLADLCLVANGKRICLAGARAEIAVTNEAPDFARIATTATLLDGAMKVTQEYEVHEEGALFCNLVVTTPGGSSLDIGGCALRAAVETTGTGKARWGYFVREPKYKRDYSTVHAFVGFSLFRKLEETDEMRQLLPFVCLDLGWDATRFCSNRVEFIVEDWTSYNDGPLAQTCTRTRYDKGVWQAEWHFLEGRTVRITGPHRYRNRWAILFGRARSQRGPNADPAVRNNALGSRICHVMYPYARGGDTWPWVSMPLKQIDEQPPQTFRGNPDVSRVEEAVAAGADTLILHQFWMRNPGSNNEPPADYQAFDPAWLKSFVDRCHQRGLRVALYVRGTEMWFQYSRFFEQFCQKDLDGMYADWHTPFCMGYVKCSPLHISAHHYFHFAKSVRRRVGDGGILIGHTSNATHLTMATFDAALGGEVSVRHEELLADPESTSYYAGLDCMGGHLISGNLPDRVAFSGPKAAAVCAALGMVSHPFMEPDVPFTERMAFLKPLWDAQASLPGKITRLHNPAYIPTRAVRTDAEHLYPSLWQSDAGKALLLITNMAEMPQSGSVEFQARELDLDRGAKARLLPIRGTFTSAQVDGGVVRLKDVPPLQFAAFLLE